MRNSKNENKIHVFLMILLWVYLFTCIYGYIGSAVLNIQWGIALKYSLIAGVVISLIVGFINILATIWNEKTIKRVSELSFRICFHLLWFPIAAGIITMIAKALF